MKSKCDNCMQRRSNCPALQQRYSERSKKKGDITPKDRQLFCSLIHCEKTC